MAQAAPGSAWMPRITVCYSTWRQDAGRSARPGVNRQGARSKSVPSAWSFSSDRMSGAVMGPPWGWEDSCSWRHRRRAMTRQAGPLIAGPSGGLVSWLAWGAVGPAAVALPVTWAADKLAGAAVRWFKRFRRMDDLSRLVKAASGTWIDFNRAEFEAVRKLLEKEETWSLLAGCEVKDLADRIAVCLPPRDGRTAEDSHVAAWLVARGLLEFAVFDLEPDIFQKVVLARLQQMTDQVTALDKALFDLHSDLYARFDDAKDLFKRVREGLPPGSAGYGDITIYLKTLIDGLNTDPWPQDQRFGASRLTPAAIERKLWVSTEYTEQEQEFDVDELAKRCHRLVVLGGPGSGKTWLAKRTARRCAEDALAALADDATLDEVELPLYTTCSQLFSARGDIRTAVASSSIDEVADLGGSRIKDALRAFFTDRNTPTLLIIDSLDEAPGPDKRLGQADTLPWRIVLTSRPSSWNRQFDMKKDDPSHRVGELQPLHYPDDVEAVIGRWFADKPERGKALAAQIARRPSLQQAATVPLILAFYCIMGGSQPLPEFRHELYTKVLNRMFTARWRGSGSRPPDVDMHTCRETLRAWALSGATSDPVSGVGTWEDDISVDRVGLAHLGEAERDALDHVATPRGFPDPDTGKTLRRFIHRSIREHLVAEHIASLPVDRAVEALLPHIWYDPDWEYSAPAALAMHPQHDRVLSSLIRCAARSTRIPRDVSVVDAWWEFRGFLARVADESREAGWSQDTARIIGQARVDLARSGSTLLTA